MSFPEPKSFNGAPGECYGDDRRDEGGGVPGGYRCLDCPWVGGDAFAHHQQAHHRIAIKVAPRHVLQFSCCPASPTAAAKDVA